ncbi:MAG: dephospho-CoA kinase [Lachnospiraceae bacterium]|nr:dephospho-CoA kinase [Lachnospiraceae bacterium]
MKTIGITGGVGCGKSAVMDYLEKNYNCVVIYADLLAKELQSPGHECYDEIVSLLGKRILDREGSIDKKKMAKIIFEDDELRMGVNAIVHPAVKEYVLNAIEREMTLKEHDYFFLEAALLIEEKYYEILDELWYIYADEEVRRERLKSSRGYSDDKIDTIFESQLSDEEYTKHCKVRIDNSNGLDDTFRQIDLYLRRDR